MTEQNKSILKLKSNISWKRVEPQDVDEMFKAFQKEDEILQETFSPTIVEYLIRDMTIESCDIEMIY